MKILAIDHIQLAMPAGGEKPARDFYQGILGVTERPKPVHLAGRGGVWFEDGDLKIHLGVDKDFHAARRAHPALLVEDLPAFSARLKAAGHPVIDDEPPPGYRRIYTEDPFGNRIELIEPL
jgi:catechol 2,3-dioxygenase-like lactoylglutathione lyase family enzyme